MSCQSTFLHPMNPQVWRNFQSSPYFQKQRMNNFQSRLMILPQICRALKLSVQQFACSQQQKLKETAETFKESTKPQLKQPPIIELISSDEQSANQHLKLPQLKLFSESKDSHSNLSEKTDSSKQAPQLQKDQFFSAIAPISSLLPKRKLIKKQNPKSLSNQKKSKFSQSFSVYCKLDLTDQVHLKSRPFLTQQLITKKEHLLLRAVNNWQEAGKGRRERREVRMLKN